MRQSHSKAARKVVLITMLLALFGAGPAIAADKDSKQSCPELKKLTITKPATPELARLAKTDTGKRYLRLRKQVVCAFDRYKPGAHIVYKGAGKHHRRPSRELVLESVARFERWLAPPAASPAASGGAAAGSAGGAPNSSLGAIASCESGGDPSAVSPDGKYRGKYQFDQQTWESVGGTGDPAAAPEGVQDALADKLQDQRGNAPWPSCG